MAALTSQLDSLVGAYLQWTNDPQEPHTSPPASLNQTIWGLKTVDVFTKQACSLYALHLLIESQTYCKRYFIVPPLTTYINAALICQGCIGSGPIGPTMCFTLCTLENFHQIHHVTPHMSIQAKARKLCNMHWVSTVWVLFTCSTTYSPSF